VPFDPRHLSNSPVQRPVVLPAGSRCAQSHLVPPDP